MTLFEITGQLKTLWEMLEGGEYDEDMLIDTIESVEGDFTHKAEGCVYVIKQMEADFEAMENMEHEFARKKEVLSNGIKRMKDRVMLMMDASGIPEIKGEHFTIKPQKAGGVLPLVMGDVNAEELPETYQKKKVEVDTKAVREALDKGIELPFAHYGERGRFLRIR